MIDIILLLTLHFCIPAIDGDVQTYPGWNCEGKLYWVSAERYIKAFGETSIGRTISGDHSSSIWIRNDLGELGGSTIHHELRHAKGYVHSKYNQEEWFCVTIRCMTYEGMLP